MKKNIENLVNEEKSHEHQKQRKVCEYMAYIYTTSIAIPFIGFVAYGVSGLHEHCSVIIDAAVSLSPVAGPAIVSMFQETLESFIGKYMGEK